MVVLRRNTLRITWASAARQAACRSSTRLSETRIAGGNSASIRSSAWQRGQSLAVLRCSRRPQRWHSRHVAGFFGRQAPQSGRPATRPRTLCPKPQSMQPGTIGGAQPVAGRPPGRRAAVDAVVVRTEVADFPAEWRTDHRSQPVCQRSGRSHHVRSSCRCSHVREVPAGLGRESGPCGVRNRIGRCAPPTDRAAVYRALARAGLTEWAAPSGRRGSRIWVRPASVTGLPAAVAVTAAATQQPVPPALR